MKPQDLSKAKNKDIATSMAAMKRAAAMARKIAIQTDTAIILVEDGKIIRRTAEELRTEGESEVRLRS